MTHEEEERRQAEFNRKADRAAGWLRYGCLPLAALLLLPPLTLVI